MHILIKQGDCVRLEFSFLILCFYIKNIKFLCGSFIGDRDNLVVTRKFNALCQRMITIKSRTGFIDCKCFWYTYTIATSTKWHGKRNRLIKVIR